VDWIEPAQGYKYVEDEVVVSAQYQAEKLTACGIDSSIFGDFVDPSFFIGLAIHAGINSGISAEGNINMLQSIRQHRPVRVDEVLTVNGEIEAVTQVPRGRTIDTMVSFTDQHGSVVITANRRSLKPDADKSGRGAGERPPLVIEDVSCLELGQQYQLTPQGVCGYSMEGNSIHYEVEAAQLAGFRAPLIGGGMGVHYLLAELWKRQNGKPVTTLSMDVYFRRPIFWDEQVTVGFQQEERLTAMALLKPGGKVGTELALHELS